MGDEKVEDDCKSQEPPIVSQPDDPQQIEDGPEARPNPFVVVYIPQIHSRRLFYGVYNCLESLRIIHGEVCENLAVQTDILLCEFTHEL